MQVQKYEQGWSSFKAYIEAKAKDRCIITNKNWIKLRDIHLGMFLQEIDYPFAFLFHMKYYHPSKYRKIRCMPKYYGIYKENRNKEFEQFTD